MKISWVIAICLTCSPVVGQAQKEAPPSETPSADGAVQETSETDSTDDGWGEDEDDGGDGFDFDEASAEPAPVRKRRNWSLIGVFQTREGFWLERLETDPIATLKSSYDLKFDFRKKPWRVRSRLHAEYDSAYTFGPRHDAATREVYEYQLVVGDQFVARSLGNFEFTLGRQTVVWGEGNMLPLVDVINPRDQREPGIGDIETSRLAVLGTRVGYFVGAHRFEAMVVHELNLGLRPSPMSEFSPLADLLVRDPAAASILEGKTLRLGEVEEPFHPRNWGGFLRWVYKGRGLDLGLYGGWLPDKQGVLALDVDTLTAFLTETKITLPLEYPRYFMAGHSGATSTGSWTFKWELLGEIGKSFNTGGFEGGELPGVEKTTVITGMLGTAWQGPDDTTVMFEISRGVFVDRPDGLLYPLDATVWAVRYGKLAMKQKLNFDVVGTAMGLAAQYGWLIRAEVGYAVRDGLKASVAAVHYGSGHDSLGEPFKAEDGSEISPFSGLKTHDLLLGALRWDYDFVEGRK